MQLSPATILKTVLIAIIGSFLAALIYREKYHSGFDTMFFGIALVFTGAITTLVSVITDIRSFVRTKKHISFFSTYVALLFCLGIWVVNYSVQIPFKKPTLVRVFYNGDINGIGLDFKTDGTYIYDDSAIGLSDYEYGTYTISGNKITLDNTKLRCINTHLLEIKDVKYVTYEDSVRKEKYVFQVNEKGETIDDFNLRVVEDNRQNNY